MRYQPGAAAEDYSPAPPEGSVEEGGEEKMNTMQSHTLLSRGRGRAGERRRCVSCLKLSSNSPRVRQELLATCESSHSQGPRSMVPDEIDRALAEAQSPPVSSTIIFAQKADASTYQKVVISKRVQVSNVRQQVCACKGEKGSKRMP